MYGHTHTHTHTRAHLAKPQRGKPDGRYVSLCVCARECARARFSCLAPLLSAQYACLGWCGFGLVLKLVCLMCVRVCVCVCVCVCTQVHLQRRGLPLANDVNISSLAGGTTGFTGADLANLVNEAALLAGRRSKAAVSARHSQTGTRARPTHTHTHTHTHNAVDLYAIHPSSVRRRSQQARPCSRNGHNAGTMQDAYTHRACRRRSFTRSKGLTVGTIQDTRFCVRLCVCVCVCLTHRYHERTLTQPYCVPWQVWRRNARY